MSPFKPDHTNLGILSHITLNTITGPIHISSIYVPFQSRNPTPNSLITKLANWLREKHIHTTPRQYLFDLIDTITARHPDDPRVLLGDFNMLWTDTFLQDWASTHNWSNSIHDYSTSISKPFPTHITTNSSTVIDHILTRLISPKSIGAIYPRFTSTFLITNPYGSLFLPPLHLVLRKNLSLPPFRLNCVLSPLRRKMNTKLPFTMQLKPFLSHQLPLQSISSTP